MQTSLLRVLLTIGVTALLLSPVLAQSPTRGDGPVDPSLLQLAAQGSSTSALTTQSLRSTSGLVPDYPLSADGKRVLVEATAATDGAALLAALEASGLRGGASYEHLVSGWLPIDKIPELKGIDGLRFVRPAYGQVSVGAVDSQGDAVMGSDAARALFGVDGTGTTVGVLSDSYGCLPNAVFPTARSVADDVASGDVPNVLVLEDLGDVVDASCDEGTDEGRGMVQLIHDVAPGADIYFATAFNTQVNFALNILSLAAAGSDVIVDDVIYFGEPMFQDGVLAQVVDIVHDAGIAYFSSAGNADRKGYETPFRQTGIVGPLGGELLDFDPGAGTDPFMSVTVPAGGTVRIVLQWDDPFFSASGLVGAASDLDIYFAEPGTGDPIIGSAAANIGGDAFELIAATNTGSVDLTLDLVIQHFAGPIPNLLKVVFAGTTIQNEYITASPTMYGHANAAGAEAVGASSYFLTPPFGLLDPRVNGFSAAGPQPILFDTDGNRLADPIVRMKPEIVGPDGTNTTMFPPFPGTDFDSDGFPNFFGTSAAAPHAAALAALMLDLNPALTPDEVYSALEQTALDIEFRNVPGVPFIGTGFDFDSGFGLIQAEGALALVEDETPPVCSQLQVASGGPFSGNTYAFVSVEDPESGIAQLTYRLKNAVGFYDLNDGEGAQQLDGKTVDLPLPQTSIVIGGEKENESARSRIVIDVTNGAGDTVTCDPVMTTLTADVPSRFELDQNYPNPFNPQTTIRFGLPDAASVRLDVFDVLGRRVVTLVDEAMDAGRYEVTWDGRNAVGQPVAGGLYVYRITAGAHTTARTMSLLK